MSDPLAEAEPRREPFLKLPAVIAVLLGLIIAVHAALVFAGEATQERVIDVFSFVPARYLAGGADHYAGGQGARVWTFFTHLFLHGNLVHLSFNGLWLMAVGTPLARRLGTLRFLGFYFLCGALSATAHMAANYGSPANVIGASGAIAGCMAGAVRVMFSPDRFFFGSGVRVGSLAPLMDRRIILMSTVWLLINFLMGSGLVPMPGQGSAGIAWEAHIGGFFAGLLLIPFFDRWAGGSPHRFRLN